MMREFFSKACCRSVVALCALLVLVPACTSTGGKILKIDARHVVALQDMRSEITSMLEGLGYESQPLSDPSTGKPVRLVEKFGQYRMLFRATDTVTVQVEVHIRRDDNMTALYFSEVGTDQPGDAAMDHYSKLRERVMLEFGADNVSDRHSFMAP